MKKAPIPSIIKVKTRIFSNMENNDCSVPPAIISRTVSWLDIFILPIKNSAKKVVSVITPKPPIWISIRMMNFPSMVNAVAISKGVRPVTQTALVETNKASIKEIRIRPLLGDINKKVPIRMMIKKLVAIIKAGLVFLPRKPMTACPRLLKAIDNRANVK